MNGHFLCEADVRSRLSLGKRDSPMPCQSFRGNELPKMTRIRSRFIIV
jgi:hypothetical protein